MIRKQSTITNILIAIEQREDRNYQASSLEVSDVSYEEICYHLELLLDAEFIVAEMMPTEPFETWIIDRLTWDGHEYLDWLQCVAGETGAEEDGGRYV